MKRLFYLLAAAAFTACGSATTLSVMTFNMRYDNPEDGADNWRFRRGRVAEVIASHGVDVFGTQELLANQLGDLKRLLPGYAAVVDALVMPVLRWASAVRTVPRRASSVPYFTGGIVLRPSNPGLSG